MVEGAAGVLSNLLGLKAHVMGSSVDTVSQISWPKMTQQQLDLHGMTQRDAVEAFVAESNAALERAGGPVTMRLVHGYGSTGEGGVLGARLRGFCDSHPDRASYVRGEDAERNPGLTIVTVESPLPDGCQRLGDAIVEYCGRARTMDRITGRFRREGGREVAYVVRDLASQGRLRKTKGRHGTEYTA